MLALKIWTRLRTGASVSLGVVLLANFAPTNMRGVVLVSIHRQHPLLAFNETKGSEPAFNRALSMMNLDAPNHGSDDADGGRLPLPKRPRVVQNVEQFLGDTVPEIVGPQTVS